MCAARVRVRGGRAERRYTRRIGQRRSAVYKQGRLRGKDRSAVVDRGERHAAVRCGALGVGRRASPVGPATAAIAGGGRLALSRRDRSELDGDWQPQRRTHVSYGDVAALRQGAGRGRIRWFWFLKHRGAL